MKLLLSFLLLLLAYSNAWRIFHNGRLHGGNLPPPPGPTIKSARVQELYFTQSLDHFDHSNLGNWQQRYFINDEYNQDNKTVFLMIGGEGEASDAWMTKGAWIDSASKYGALLFQLEHRFYGKSQPTPNLSTENLRFLNAQQALADLATFITAMNKQHDLPKDVKWIVFGGSYPGNLAAWMRQLYPHLVHGAMSASGPVLAKLDFLEYYGVVANDLVALHGQECADAVQEATNQVFASLQWDAKVLNEKFKLCTPIEESLDNELDVANFWSALAGNFAGVAQYNDDQRISTGGASSINIQLLCKILVNTSMAYEIDRLAAVNSLLLEDNAQECLDYKYSTMIDYLREDSKDQGGMRQWVYQTCTEFGYYQTSSNQPQIFGNKFPLTFSVQQCIDIFGPDFKEAFIADAVNHTNVLFGGLDIEVSNVVYVHGTVDPWHALGVVETVDERAPAILINGTAHCANMYPSGEADRPGLVDARVEVDRLIGEWLKD